MIYLIFLFRFPVTNTLLTCIPGGQLSIVGGYSWPEGVDLVETWDEDRSSWHLLHQPCFFFIILNLLPFYFFQILPFCSPLISSSFKFPYIPYHTIYTCVCQGGVGDEHVQAGARALQPWHPHRARRHVPQLLIDTHS